MKIISRQNFMNMPKGTLYCDYEPSILGSLSIKGDNCGDFDFFTQDIVGDATIEEFTLNHTNERDDIETTFDIEGRDGTFDDMQLYAVFSKNELLKLIERLKKAADNQ